MTSQIGQPRWPRRWRALGLASLGAVTLGVIVAAPVVGHSELVTPTPTDGATVAGDPPPTISGTYSETLDPAGSSLVLVDSTGKTIATGGVADASQPTKAMAIEAVPVLAPGDVHREVDDEVRRGRRSRPQDLVVHGRSGRRQPERRPVDGRLADADAERPAERQRVRRGDARRPALVQAGRDGGRHGTAGAAGQLDQ